MKKFVQNWLTKYICHECARAAGGVDRGGQVTIHEGLCDRCKQLKPVTAGRNYSWPSSSS